MARLGARGLAAVGALAVVEQVGRLPGGEAGAVLRGVSRVKITGGTTGPGAALWVEGAVLDETERGARADELAKEYKSLVISVLQTRGAWQVVDLVQQIDDPSLMADRAGYASYLTAEQKLTLLETADVTERLEQRSRGPASTWPSWMSPRRSARTSPRAWRSSRRSPCCASSSPPSARR
jgi:ATP-dependent Lon protease